MSVKKYISENGQQVLDRCTIYAEVCGQKFEKVQDLHNPKSSLRVFINYKGIKSNLTLEKPGNQ